jgi:hypothetical protein
MEILELNSVDNVFETSTVEDLVTIVRHRLVFQCPSRLLIFCI